MSDAGTQVAPLHASQPKSRSPLAHLLHALNQPLTGLQCSLELALASPRRREEYVRTLREGLQLIERMRILVEGVRELTAPSCAASTDQFDFDRLLRETVEGLAPVAESKNVRWSLVSTAPLPLCGDRRSMEALIFRLLESVISLTRSESEVTIELAPSADHASLVVTWNPAAVPEHSPFSRPELGLLIAQAGLERGGAECALTRHEGMQTCTVHLPSSCPRPASSQHRTGDLR